MPSGRQTNIDISTQHVLGGPGPKVRVLHTLGSLNPGGVQTWLLHVLRFIDHDRFQFYFCIFGPEPGLYATDVEKLGAEVLQCPKDCNWGSFRQRFRKILREGRYDILHSHVHLFSGVLLRWAAAEGVPARIAHSHTSQDDRLSTLTRRCYSRLMRSWIDRYTTHGLACSEAAAHDLFGEHWKSDGRFRVLHCGIDLRPFEKAVDRGRVRQELGIPPNARVVGHVGSFIPGKNHRFLLKVARQTLQRQFDVHFLLIGDGPLRGEIEARARSMGLSGKTHFVGRRTDVARLMRGAMDVFVFPSLWEGLPITVIEAQAAGLSCILSDAITSEVCVVRELSVRLPLLSGPEAWGKEIIEVLNRDTIDHQIAWRAVAESDFSIDRSTLSELYSTAAG